MHIRPILAGLGALLVASATHAVICWQRQSVHSDA